MPNEFDPIVGNWYRDLDAHQYFTVVALDPREETGAIQQL
jgi:hypothetical protein